MKLNDDLKKHLQNYYSNTILDQMNIKDIDDIPQFPKK